MHDLFYEVETSALTMVFEFCDSDLRIFIKNHKQIKLTTIKIIFRQIVEAVDFFHQEQIYHWDLKPSNILLKDQHVYIADLGMSK